MKNNYIVFLSLFLLCFLSKLQAQIFVKSTASGSNDGTSWENAYTNLQDAIAAATSGDEVWVAQGTYYPDDGIDITDNDRNATFQLKNGVAIYGGFVGNETQLSERNWTANETILSGDINQSGTFNGNTLTVVTGSDTDVSAVIDGFTITWGNEDAAFLGAGMLNISGSPRIRNNKFSNNKALVGGGIFNQNSSSPVIINCSFIGNQVSFGGGGILNQSNSSPVITNCLFSGNLALNGGGVYNDNNCSPVIVNSTFINNTVQDHGGGIFNNINSNPTLTNTIIWDNIASGVTTSASASVSNSNSTPVFNYSLIANSGGSASWISSIGSDDGNNIDANPQFNDANNADFRLQFGSTAINAGTPDVSGLNLPAEDFSGNPRVSDGTIDMGAFEFQKLPISPNANNILYVNQSAVIGNQSGDSWENATLELRDALSWAANTWDGSNAPLQIWVAKGTYLPTVDGTDRNSFFQLVNNVEIYGGFNGNETDLIQRNYTTHETILSGDIDADETLLNNSYTIVNGSGTDTTALLDGFIITNGNADGVTEITARGAGMYNDAGSPEVSNCKFSGNSAVFGGGVYNVNNSSPGISNCSILDNQATASGGGLLNVNSSPFVVNTLFSGNSADNGGGLFNDATSSAIVTNTTFSENTAVFNGGAIFNGNSNPNLTNIIVWNNTADGITTTASSSVFNSTSSPVISFSLIANSGGSASWNNSIGIDNGNNLDTDPLFQDSTSGDFALNDNSPAKNVGTPDVTGLNLPAIDLAGNPRIFDGIIDMGAFENQIACPSANILYVSASATGNNLGTSWADAYTDLQDALDNNCAGVAEIWVAAGTYQPSKYPANCNGCNNPRDNTFQLKDGIALYGGFNGTETTLSERDFENNVTILSGDYNDDDTVSGSGNTLVIFNNNENAYHVVLAAFPVNDTTSTTLIDGFTITGGNANGGQTIAVNGINYGKDNGGGIYTIFGNNTILNNKIEACTAGSSGGGIFLNRGINTFTNNIILFNRADSGGGAYILFGTNAFSANTISNNTGSPNSGGGLNFRNSNSTLTNNIISMNFTPSFGGGINFDEGTYQLIDNTIEDNSASVGGGIRFKIGNVTLTNNQINNNGANLGGGFFSGTTSGEDLQDNGTFNFTGNTISGNTSANRGGGASINRGSYTFTNNTISNNAAGQGGGGFFISNATTNFNDNTISSNSLNNTTGLAGGGLVFIDGTNSLSKNTIENNSATNAAGILFQEGTNNLTGNRVIGNTANQAAGGIFAFQGTNTLINNSFYSNTASIGGGIYLEEGTNALVNNSITGNTANTNGGGLYFDNSSPIVINTILWNNAASGSTTSASASVFNEISTPTFSYSLIANSGGSSSWETAIGTDNGNNIDLDPLFFNPATNDFTLQKGSLAINAGSNAAYQSATGNDPAGDTDLNENLRLFQSTIDMGAFEADFKQSQWRGTLSEDWANSANWDEGVPDDQSVALIRDISLNIPHVSATTHAEVSDLILAENTALMVNDVLKVTETINNNGQITFTSDVAGTGQFDEFTGTISGSGNVRVERYIPASNRAFRFLSSPVNTSGSINENWQEGATTDDLTPNPNPGFGTHITGGASGNGFDQTGTNNPSMFTFDNTNSGDQDNAWIAVSSTISEGLLAGTPYLLFVRGDRGIDLTQTPTLAQTETTLRATGTLFTGVDNTQILSQINDFYSLVANPYQANVNFDNLTTTGLRSDIIVFDPSVGTFGQYETLTSNKIISPGQSFFVQNISNVISSSITFNESDKATAGTNNTTVFSNDFPKNANLELYNSDDMRMDVMKFRFKAGYNNALDDNDTGKLFNQTESLASLNANMLLSVERRDIPGLNEIIPLNLIQYQDTNYEFRLVLEDWDSNIEVFVVDNYLNTQSAIAPNQAYNFSVDANILESTASDRFSLVFDNTTLGVDDNRFGADFSLYPNPTDDGHFSIKTYGLSKEHVNIKIYNMLGQQLMNQSLKIGSNGEVNVDASALSSGVYMVELMHEEVKIMAKLIKE